MVKDRLWNVSARLIRVGARTCAGIRRVLERSRVWAVSPHVSQDLSPVPVRAVDVAMARGAISSSGVRPSGEAARCRRVRRHPGHPARRWSEEVEMRSRRDFLAMAGMVAVGLLGARTSPAAGAGAGTDNALETAGPSGPRYLVVNADDLGLSIAINRGIIETHAHGIVTSASLLVTAPAAADGVQRAGQHPALSLGLEVDLTRVSLNDLAAVRSEVERQLALFIHLTGGPPTHIDSRRHVHDRFNVARVFLDASARYGAPLRGFAHVVYLGGFYGKAPDGRTDLRRISVDALSTIVASVRPGLSELGCRPGYFDKGADDGYGRERQIELLALTDPRLRRILQREAITLVSHRQSPRLASRPPHLIA
jgi:chitin disaccharide deacetylase